MPSYPTTIRQDPSGAKEPWLDPLLIDYSKGGNVKGRRLQSTYVRQFVVPHRKLSAAERTVIKDFYDLYRNSQFDFAWSDVPGTVWQCIFADQNGLDWSRDDSGLYWNIDVKLAQVI